MELINNNIGLLDDAYDSYCFLQLKLQHDFQIYLLTTLEIMS